MNLVLGASAAVAIMAAEVILIGLAVVGAFRLAERIKRRRRAR